MASSKTAAGKKRITINDIAQMAGTSKTTVSFYLNGKTDRMSEETQKRIRLAIDETGYQPSPLARGMNAEAEQPHRRHHRRHHQHVLQPHRQRHRKRYR